jgi:hypothetical protein
MIHLTHQQVTKIVKELSPVNIEELFDNYLDSRAFKSTVIFGTVYTPSMILKMLNRDKYEEELAKEFQDSPHYLKIRGKFYHDFQVRELLEIVTPGQIQGSTI